jgi:protein phosphatase
MLYEVGTTEKDERQQKHLRSRAVVVVCRDESVSLKRFGVIGARSVLHPQGPGFFEDAMLEKACV